MDGEAIRWRRVRPLVGALVCASSVESASAAEPSQPRSQSSSLAEMSIEELMNVQTSPFEVSASLDDGYHASNSVSGSRFDAPIIDLPFAIQAFTQAFITDQKPVNVFDVARYSPG